MHEILVNLDITKSRGPNGLPPIFFQKTASATSATFHVMLKNIKRLRKIPSCWKLAAETCWGFTVCAEGR